MAPLERDRASAPCRYCGGIFRIAQVDEDSWTLRCDGCGLQTKTFDCGEGEEEQTRALVEPTEDGKVPISRPRALEALRLVRAALDSDARMGLSDIENLHVAEELLASELGQPIWEGRG